MNKMYLDLGVKIKLLTCHKMKGSTGSMTQLLLMVREELILELYISNLVHGRKCRNVRLSFINKIY